MPTYQYLCKDCGNELEVVQKFTDDALTECPACDDGELRKVFNAVGVVFKGSGFYRTDSRASGKNASGASSDKKSATDSGSKGGDSSAKSGSTGSAGSSSSTPTAAGSATN